MSSWLCAAEDRTDRACWFGSIALFGFCALYSSVAMQMGGGPPMRCLMPKEFPRSWIEHAETKCWESPLLIEEVNRTHNPYWQGPTVKNYLRWIPAIFAAIAVAMAAPQVLWRAVGHRAHELVALSAACQWQPWAERSHVTAYVADELRRPSVLPCTLACAYLLAKAATCAVSLLCLRLLGLPFGLRHPLGPARLLLTSEGAAAWHAGLMPSAYHCEYGNQLHGHQHTYRLSCAFTHEAMVNCLCLAAAIWLLVCAVASCAACLAWLVALLPPVRACLLARHRGVGGVGVCGFSQAADPARLSCDSALMLMHVDAAASGLLARDILQQLARLQADAAANNCVGGCDMQFEDPSSALLTKEQPSSFIIEPAADTNHKGM